MGRPPCCDKSNVKRGLWTPEEDAKMLAYVANHGIGNWTLVPKKAGLNRCGKSCRLRWTNYLRSDLKHDGFTPQEEEIIINFHKAIGSRWSLIAQQLPGRTDNDVKNYWNTKLRKKLLKMGIDPVTHKPISQILSDYGNISGRTNTANRIGPLNKSLISTNNNCVSKAEQSPALMSSSPSFLTSMIMKSIGDQAQRINLSNLNNAGSLFQVENQNGHNYFSQPTPPFCFNEVTSPCSSSSSTAFTQLNSPKAESSTFKWNEFLIGDQQQVQRRSTMQNETTHCDFDLPQRFGRAAINEAFPESNNNNGDACSSSAASSFVDGILDRDREMSSQFPQLMDSCFDFE